MIRVGGGVDVCCTSEVVVLNALMKKNSQRHRCRMSGRRIGC